MFSRNKLTMCRLCLSENECFINIFEMNDWQGYVAADVISDLFQFQVSISDGYPHVVCSKCLMKLTDFKLFKEHCQKSKVTYDNMYFSSDSPEDHQPEMDNGEGASGLELCEQDPLREETSDPFIKQEELDIDCTSCDGSVKPFEGTNTEVIFGPIRLKDEVLPFNQDSTLQEKLIKSEEFGNADTVELATTLLEDSTQGLEYERHYGASKAEVNADSYIRNIRIDDGPMFEKSKNISLNIEVEASSSGMMARSDEQWIPPEERMYVASFIQGDMDIRKESGREEKVMGIEGNAGRETYPQKRVVGESERLECFHCGNLLKTKRSLIHHMKFHGFGNSYDCDICGRIFYSISDLKRHIMSHTGSKPYKCATCGKGFGQSSDLKKHMRTHTGFKPYKCAKCSKTFAESYNLKIHMTSHRDSKPYKCAECSKRFKGHINLKKHMRIHTDCKPYICAECSKMFSQKSYLNKHMKIHTSPKLYKCAECNKSFSKSDYLNMHMASHNDSKLYKCEECSKSFNSRSNLKKHIRVHTGYKPYKCSECTKTFSQSCNLKSHMRIHTCSKPYKCAECSRSFSVNSSLKRHMKSHRLNVENVPRNLPSVANLEDN